MITLIRNDLLLMDNRITFDLSSVNFVVILFSSVNQSVRHILYLFLSFSYNSRIIRKYDRFNVEYLDQIESLKFNYLNLLSFCIHSKCFFFYKFEYTILKFFTLFFK